MICTKSFLESAFWLEDARNKAMANLNKFIEINKIEKSNILEFRTRRDHNPSEERFEVIISWWQ